MATFVIEVDNFNLVSVDPKRQSVLNSSRDARKVAARKFSAP
jgi:hypothetical protein